MKKLVIGVVALSVVAGHAACGNDDAPPGGEQTGQSCASASECFANLPDAALHGTPLCITRVTGGYCTHTCTTDADCCAVAGECRTSYRQVCAPFESMAEKYCFLSCETVPGDAGVADPEAFCHTYAHAAFNCRSSGGGSENRKICVP